MKKVIIYTLLLLSLPIFAFTVYAKELELKYPDLPGLPPLTDTTPLPDLINYVFTLTVTMAGIIAFISFVYAGFLFFLSGANPGLRQKAKKRISDVLTGLMLLLGIFVFLNILNPDLAILNQPGVAPTIPDQIKLGAEPPALIGAGVDLLSLRYGGFVFYADYNNVAIPQYNLFTSQGQTGRSETINHFVFDFGRQTYINTNTGNGSYNNPAIAPNAVSAVKILGSHVSAVGGRRCEVTLKGAGASSTLSGRGVYDLNSLVPALNNNVAQSIPSIVSNCIGNSLRLFEHAGFNDPTDGGSLMLIDSHADFKDLDFAPPISFLDGEIVNDKTSSLMASITESKVPFTYTACVNNFYGRQDKGQLCEKISNNFIALLANPYHDSISSIQFSSEVNRQAGVILYSDPNYRDRSEVLITSDPRLDRTCSGQDPPVPPCAIPFSDNDGNFSVAGGGNDTASPTGFAPLNKGASSLKIIGKYRVTLYTGRNYFSKPADATPAIKKITINNAVSKPCVVSDAIPGEPLEITLTTDPKSESIIVKPGMIYIKDLGDSDFFCMNFIDNDSDKGCQKQGYFEDKIVSIKLQLSKEIVDAQGLVPDEICNNDSPLPPGIETVTECGETIDFCTI